MRGKHYNTHYNIPDAIKKDWRLIAPILFLFVMCGLTAKTDVYPVETPPTKTKND